MDKEILPFELAKVNRGKEKLCKCNPPHYEIDTTNRIVMCTDCGAVVDAFDALVNFVENYEEIEERQRKMLSKASAYEQLANEEIQKMIKNKVFRTMNEQFKRGMLPICPNCKEAFNPTEIQSWTRGVLYGTNNTN